MMTGKFENATDAMSALTAGNATVTLVSLKTDTRYTFKVRKAESKPGQKPVWFVSLLTGPSNTSDFNYIGLLAESGFRTTAKSRLPSSSAPVAAFGWSVAKLAQGSLPTNLEVWHEGKCCKCGRKLTVPESVARGFGPECAQQIAA